MTKKQNNQKLGQDELIGASEVAQKLGLTRAAVNGLSLPYFQYKERGKRLYKLSDVQALINNSYQLAEN